MPQKLRSFLGPFLFLILVLYYKQKAVSIASAYLGQSPFWVHLIYFTVSGLVWPLPAMALIKWMASPKKNDGA